MSKLNNEATGLILNGILRRIETISDSCEDEQTVAYLSTLSDDISVVISDMLGLLI